MKWSTLLPCWGGKRKISRETSAFASFGSYNSSFPANSKRFKATLEMCAHLEQIPDTTKESQLDFCLCVAGAGARVSKGALLLKTTTDTALHRCAFTEDWSNLAVVSKQAFQCSPGGSVQPSSGPPGSGQGGVCSACRGTCPLGGGW